MNPFPLKTCVLLGLIFLSPFFAQESRVYGQEIFAPDKKSLTAEAHFTNQQPEVDGKLTDLGWTNAKLLTNFVQVEPHQGEGSAVETRVRLLYTKNALYVGVFCAEPLGHEAYRAPDMKRDFAWRKHDTFAIAIDGFKDKRNSSSFATNPYGAKKDYLSFDDTFYDGSWNGLWKVRTSRSDSGWVAEFEIPFKTLRYPDKNHNKQDWGINFLRLRRVSNEISVWSPYPRSFGFNRMEYAGVLQKLEVPEPSSNIQVNPYFLTSNNNMAKVKDQKLRHTKFKPGGNIKWAVTPNTVIDFTANTDFAQAEADIKVNNVSRFSVLFPERRPFFLENASLFGAGLTGLGGGVGGDMRILPFFSRRIGLDSHGAPIPIDAGIRAVHRSVKRNAGILYMHQRSSNFSPAKHIAVGRFAQNIGKQSRLGALTTLSASSQLNNQIDWLGAIDGFFRLEEAHSLSTMIMQSGNTGSNPSGIAGYLQYLYTSNSVNAWWTQSLISEDFNPKLGFVSRENVIATTPGVFTNLRGEWLPFKQLIRSFRPGVEMGWYHLASSGMLTERKIQLYPFWIDLQNGGSVRYSLSFNHQNLTDGFNPLGVNIDSGIYSYNRHSFAVKSDPSRSLSFSAKRNFGPFYDGQLVSTELKLTTAPTPHINLMLQYNRNRFKNIGINNRSKIVNLYTLRSHLALNPRLELTGIYQKNTKHDTNAYNIRFDWEYKPLSHIYLVFNSREYLNNQQLIRREASAIIKLTYLAQF